MIRVFSLIVLLFPATVLATPSISSVSDTTPTHGDTITITGTGFGTKTTAAPTEWMTFESLTADQTLSSQTDWGGAGMYIRDTSGVQLNRSQKNCEHWGWRSGGSNGSGGADKYVWGYNGGKRYFTGWIRFMWAPDQGDTYPFDGTGQYGYQIKLFQFSAEPGETGAFQMVAYMYDGDDNVFWQDDEPAICCGDDYTQTYARNTRANVGTATRYFSGPGSTPVPPEANGDWVQYEVWIDQGTPGSSDGHITMCASDHAGGAIRCEVFDNTCVVGTATDCTGGGGDCWYNEFKFGYYLDDLVSGEVKIYWDDLYMDDSWSRVMLGDSPAWSTCTKRVPCVASSWSDTSVEVVFNAQNFTDGSTAYLYVVDSTGAVSAGQQVTITASGGGGDPEPPASSMTYSVGDGDGGFRARSSGGLSYTLE